MKPLQLRTVLVLLALSLSLSLSTATAWSSQVPAMSAAGAHADVPEAATVKSGKDSGAANEGLRSIFSEEEMPAFLHTDPCDTGDS